MRINSWKFRLVVAATTALIGGGALAPAATAAPLPQADAHQTSAVQRLPTGDDSNDAFGEVTVGEDNARLGDRACAGNCNGTVNGTNGSDGGICAGLCDGSANGGRGTNGGPGQNGTNGGNGGVCVGVCGGSANGGDGGDGGDAVDGGDGGDGGTGGDGGLCVGVGCETSGQGGRGGNGGQG
ncbi:hypothetical protein H1V43_05285 [Streptomyces sp. PSKA54]|uniref:PE-PGRS family protein n=1 Tax=Streptomyces himalayensis subsp. aureolus TaxID=2758039 RepID=A0A7W2CXC1_9ACTN|nr:hypothetical protein [Streptomyces himalayensis]MBA4860799.1 hypothetical protein [Streptomyces himalayensis subsp. aureolus]